MSAALLDPPAPTPAERLAPPVDFFARHAPGTPDAGRVIERDRSCLCGRRFVQSQVSAEFVALAERAGGRASEALVRDVPSGWVPVHCPACESRHLGRGSAT